MTKQVPVADGLFTWPSENPALIGGRSSDGRVVFPYRRQRIIGRTREQLEQVELPRRGTLWSFTTQSYRPPSPPYAGNDDEQSFKPYTVGYVELPGALRIEARLTESDPAKLAIGQEVELRIVPFAIDSRGNETMTYAFAPVHEDGDANAVK